MRNIGGYKDCRNNSTIMRNIGGY